MAVVVLGLGNVGRQFVQVWGHRAHASITALVDTSAAVGGPPSRAAEHKASGGALATLDGADPDPDPAAVLAGARVLVDAAVGDTRRWWDAALAAGVSVVSANKDPLADPGSADWLPAWREGRLGVGATVGAGVPSAGALHRLDRTGDRILAVEGIVSGTFSAILAALAAGTPLSRAVAEARDQGVTEPDPVADLCGADVGRKFTILAHLAGLPTRPFRVEPVLDASWLGLPAEELDRRLVRYDRVWQARAQAAARSGRVLRYVGRVDADGIRCGLQALPRTEGLGRLTHDENGVRITSDRDPQGPVLLVGPARGPRTTAFTLADDVAAALARS
jgi:homoserine dehydrogenase